MANGDREYRTDITADPSSYITAWRKVEDATRAGSDRVVSSVSKISDGISSLQGRVGGLLAALGVGAFAASVRAQLEMADAMGKAAQSAGVGTAAFSELAYAGSLADLQSETLGKSMGKLSTELVKAAAGDAPLRKLFEDTLNVKVRDAAGQVRSADAVLEDLADRFASMEDGAKKTALAARLFGEELGPKLIPFLNQGKQGITSAREEARRLGLSIGDELSAQAETFNDNMTRAGKAADGAKLAIGNELLPQVIRLSELFVQAANDVGVAQAALITFGSVVARVLGVDEQGKAEVRYKRLNAEVERLSLVLLGVQNTLSADPDNSAAQRRVATLTAKIEDLKKQAIEANAEVARIAAGNPNAGGGRGFVNPPVVKGPGFNPDVKDIAASTKPAENRMGQWETELAQKKVKLEREALLDGQYRHMSKADEGRYWSSLLAQKGLTEEEKRALTRRTAELELATIKETFEGRVRALQSEGDQYRANVEERLRVERQIQALYGAGTKEYEEAQRRIAALEREATQQSITLAQLAADAKREAAAQTIALDEEAARHAADLGLITTEQLLGQLMQFEEQRFQLQMQAATARIEAARVANDLDLVEVERLNMEKERLEREHRQRMGQLGNEKEAEKLRGPMDVFKTAEQGIASMGTTMLTNWKQAGTQLRSIFASIGTTLIQELVMKPLAAKVMAWMKERALSLAGIGAKASEAGAGAASSVSAIPIVGPALALASMAAVFAAVSGMSGSVPSFSAAGGFDIPGSINPIVQAHANEMVLPAKHADVIRRMAEEGTPQSSAQAPALPPIVLRGVSAGQFFIAVQSDLAKAIARMNRDNALRPR